MKWHDLNKVRDSNGGEGREFEAKDFKALKSGDKRGVGWEGRC